ncbi:MAG: hypothetical protein IH972_02000 [Candidatus Marinimicrobia bacterium]|nr:hypothetical protein [Candidatus Neomarinimicrobiota bacterium]
MEAYDGELVMVQPQEIHRVPLRSVLEAYEGVTSATHTAKAILTLFGEDQIKILSLGRAAGSVQQLHTYMEQNPIFAVVPAAQKLNQTPTTTRAALKRLMKLDIVKPYVKMGRNQYYTYKTYLALLSEGTEL